MATDAPHPVTLLALVATVTACSLPPILVAGLGPVPALAVGGLVAALVTTVVVGVAHDGTFGPDARDRYRRTAVTLVVLAFILTAFLTPPDPRSQLVFGAPAVAGALLLALVTVAYDVDDRIPLPT